MSSTPASHSDIMQYHSVFVVFLALASCGAPPVADAPTDRGARLAQAEELLTGQQPHEALRITDALLAEDGDDRAALLLAMRGNTALFDAGASGQEFFLADAISLGERALHLDKNDGELWLEVARLHLANSDFDAGRMAALQAAEVFKADRRPTDVARAVLAAADNEMQVFVDARRAENGAAPDSSTVALGNAVLQRVEFAKAHAPAEAHAKASMVYQWLGEMPAALHQLELGVEAAPDEAQAHEALQNLYFGMGRQLECAAHYKRMAAERPDHTLTLWYLGRAQVALADQHRRDGDLDTANQGYERAANTYGRYRAMMPQHAEVADWWIAACKLARGRVAIDLGDLDTAQQEFAAAYEANPKVADYDDNGMPAIYDSFGGNYVGGLFMVGQTMAQASTTESLERTLAFYDALNAKHEGRFGTFYNNAALAARDLGVAVARSANADGVSPSEREALQNRAMELWERSYLMYEKAVELEPDDPRIVNDCGLMLIYHLHRDYDRARALFDRAAEIGEAELDALPDDADEQTRRFLEEATGDAYQNIAVLLRQQERPFEEYRDMLERAVELYPYQMREAAQILRAERGGDGGPGGDGSIVRQDPAPGPGQDPVDPRAAELAPVEREARKKADAGDFDGALLVLDKHAGKFKDSWRYHYLAGLWARSYAQQSAAANRGAGLIDGLFADAQSNLQKAVDLDSDAVSARLELAGVMLDRGEFANAAEVADRTLSHIRSAGITDAATLTAAHAVAADASTRVFVAAKSAGNGDSDALLRARGSFRELERQEALDAQQLKTWASLEQWAQAGSQAVAVWARALQTEPDSDELLAGLVDTAANASANGAAVEALAERDDALGQWYLGKARFQLAREQWAKSEIDAAAETFDAAVQAFSASKEKNPGYAASSDQWIAYCAGTKGLALLGAKRFEDAEKVLLEAAANAPAQANDDLGNGVSIKQGLQLVADHYFRDNDLERTESVFRAASEALPQDGDLANNHGLMARDFGVSLERAGEAERAQEMYEASYRSYTRASQLEPTSVRLMNDRALLLIYHLKNDWPLALELIERGIEMGEEQLAATAPGEERQPLEEAVGDLYQNRGTYLELHKEDFEAAIAEYEKSLTYYPFERRAGRGFAARAKRKLDERRAAEAAEGGDAGSGGDAGGGGEAGGGTTGGGGNTGGER